jgi:hypothetical protein
MITTLKHLDSHTFALLGGRKWKSLETHDSTNISWFDDLNAELHKFILVSGEKFSSEGREGEENFITESLIADPDSDVNNPGEKLIIIFDKDLTDAAILADAIEKAEFWLGSVRDRADVQIYQAIHKIRST